MYAIETKYLGPTNTKGARIRVTHGDVSRVYPYDSSSDYAGAHYRAVKRFCAHPGSQVDQYPLPDAKASDFAQARSKLRDGYVFVFVAFGWKGHDSD